MFIVFEGIDGSGKQTQADGLFEYLIGNIKYKEGDISLDSFPKYNTVTGQEIHRILTSGQQFDQHYLNILFAANRYEHKEYLEHLIASCKFVIVDRYYHSNWVYGNFKEPVDKDWLYKLDSRLPKPDLVFLIDTPVEVTIKRKENLDMHESRRSFQIACRARYLELARTEPSFVEISGNQSIDSVHKDIVKEFENRVKSFILE